MIPTSEEILSKNPGALRVATVNVNGIRAAYRRNMADWVAARDVDILCLQEVRAPDKVVHELVGEGWHILHAEAKDKGRAGVAVLSRTAPVATRANIGDEYFNDAGRWVEADFDVNGEILTVVSVYVHSGELETQKQIDKYRFLERMTVRLAELKSEKDHVLAVGDMNVVHTEKDIKNWKPNHNKRSGVMDEEIAYFDHFFSDEFGYKDVVRELHPGEQGPYAWWSWRGQAFVNNAGWRIDYQIATPALAAKAHNDTVDRASAYDLRFSDHAPVVVDYQF